MVSDPVEESANLPLGERLEHTHWKVRSLAYEELSKTFSQSFESTSPVFSQYSNHLRKILNDKNAVAMEKGLDVLLAFYDRYEHASSITSKIVSLLIEKCLGARQGTKQKAVSILCLMVEVDTSAEPVILALIEGTGNKVPKIGTVCIQTMELILNTFGIKVMSIKPIITHFIAWFDHTNAEYRAAALSFTRELYRWVGDAVLSKPISTLRQAQIVDLKKAFEELPKDTQTVPQRYLRSHIEEIQQLSSPSLVDTEKDSFGLFEATNVFSKITSDIYDALQSKKWKEKKEALEFINKEIDVPRLATGDYSQLFRLLKQLIGDTNVFVVEETIHCLGLLALGLRADFAPLARNVLSKVLDKLKERKIVTTIQTTLDNFHPHTFLLSDVQEDITIASKHKVPLVKKELLIWLRKSMVKDKRTLLLKNLKYWCNTFMELMDDGDSPVRENAFETFGLLIGIVGERSVAGFMNQLDKIKEKRVKEFIPQAPVSMPLDGESTLSNPNPILSSITSTSNIKAGHVNTTSSCGSKTPIRKSTLNTKPKINRTTNTSRTTARDMTSNMPKSLEVFTLEPRVPLDEIESRFQDAVPQNIPVSLCDKNWNVRLEAMSLLTDIIEKMDDPTLQQNAEVFILYLVFVKPTFKETNSQTLLKMLDAFFHLLKLRIGFHKQDIYILLHDMIDHLHDPKLNPICFQILNVIGEHAEPLGIQFVFLVLYALLKEHNNPKVLREGLNYMNQALVEFGHSLIDFRQLVVWVKQIALESNVPFVKSTGIKLLCEIYKTMDGNMLALLSDVRPQLMTTINKELEKVLISQLPLPIRGPNTSVIFNSSDSQVSSPISNVAKAERVDISASVNLIIPDLGNSDWQKRQESMLQLETLLIQSGSIQSKNLPPLIHPIKNRLTDSNSNLIPLALNLLGLLASVTGSPIEAHLKVIMPSIINCFGNTKATIRLSCAACLQKWTSVIGIDPLLPYITTALSSSSIRHALLSWLEPHIHFVKKSDLRPILKLVIQGHQDKSKDVRVASEACFSALFYKLGARFIDTECRKSLPNHYQQIRLVLKSLASLDVKRQSTEDGGNSNPLETPLIITPDPLLSAIKERSCYSQTENTEILDNIQREDQPEATSLPTSFTSPHPPRTERNAAILPTMRRINTNIVLILNNKASERSQASITWAFDHPIPPRMVDLLREQAKSCFSPELLQLLFSNDACHLADALSILESAMEDQHQRDAFLSSLDVILKWCSLRLFDSNLALIKRTLNFMEYLFGNFELWPHQLSDLEASSIICIAVFRIPHLNPSAASMLRELLLLVQKFYPASKMFRIIFSSTQAQASTVNTRSFARSLDYMAYLIRQQSITVCQQKETLGFISTLLDHNESQVVNSALSALNEAYRYLKEDFWSYFENLHQKHKITLREYFQNPPKLSTQPIDYFSNQEDIKQTPSDLENAKSSSSQPGMPNHSPYASLVTTSNPVQPPLAGSKSVDPIFKRTVQADLPLFTLDLGKIDQLRVDESTENNQIPPGISPTILPSDFHEDPSSWLSSNSTTAANRHAKIRKTKSPRLNQFDTSLSSCLGISNEDFHQNSISVKIQSLIALTESNQVEQYSETLEDILAELSHEPKTRHIFEVDSLASCLTNQLKQIHDGHLLSTSTCTSILNLLMTIFTKESYAKLLSTSVLKTFILMLIEIIIDSSCFTQLFPQHSAAMAKFFNSLIARVIDYSDRTSLFKILLEHLRDKLPPDELPGEITSGSSIPTTIQYPEVSAAEIRGYEILQMCLKKLQQSLSSYIQTISVPIVLREIHLFLVAHPPHTWSKRKNKTSFELIKMLISDLVGLLSTNILQHMYLIPATYPPPSINWYIKQSLISTIIHPTGSTRNDSSDLLKDLISSNRDPSEGLLGFTEFSQSISTSHLRFLSIPLKLPTPQFHLSTDYTQQELECLRGKIETQLTGSSTFTYGLTNLYWLLKDHPKISIISFTQNISKSLQENIQEGLNRYDAISRILTTPMEQVTPHEIQTALGVTLDTSLLLSYLKSLNTKMSLPSDNPAFSISATNLDLEHMIRLTQIHHGKASINSQSSQFELNTFQKYHESSSALSPAKQSMSSTHAPLTNTPSIPSQPLLSLPNPSLASISISTLSSSLSGFGISSLSFNANIPPPTRPTSSVGMQKIAALRSQLSQITNSSQAANQ